MDKKVLGILGGMGPLATSYFFQEILRWTDAKKDRDHLRIIIDNNVDIPSRTRALMYGEVSPVEPMRQACLNLMEMGCDYIAVPCNSAHSFFDDVVKDTEIPWVNMIKVVSDALADRESVLILGGYNTISGKLYDKYLDNTLYLKDNKFVYSIIEEMKTNTIDFVRLAKLYDAINDASADCVLLACTELPMILNRVMIPHEVGCKLINGNEIYIKKLIGMCGGVVRDE